MKELLEVDNQTSVKRVIVDSLSIFKVAISLVIDSLIDCKVETSVENHHRKQPRYHNCENGGFYRPYRYRPIPAKLTSYVEAEKVGDVNVYQHTQYKQKEPVPIIDSNTVVYVRTMVVKYFYTSVTHFTMF